MLTGILVSLLLGNADAVPLQLTQQGRVLDNNGAAVSGSNDLTFRIYDSSTGGSIYWSETITINFTNGYYAVVLGSDEINNPLDSSVLSLYPLYLEVQLNSNTPMSTRYAINSAPYAQMAGNAEVADSIDGGTVNATEVSINSNQVIDGTGSWVGQPITVDWNNIDPNTIPSYIADGDDNTQLSETEVENYVTNAAINLGTGSQVAGQDIVTTATDSDTLAGLSCSTGEIAGWNGSAWTCVSDSTLDSAGLATLLSSNGYNLNVGTTIGGQAILSTDNDTLASLNCLDGEFARWDALISQWYCDSDSLEQLNCQDGEVVTYSSSSGGWVCSTVLSMLDNDSDGTVSWDDCDDNDPNSNTKAIDADCDGVLTGDDCNDANPTSTTILTDADCDGVVTLDDCDDNDASSTIVSNDADCDSILASIDCDDNDPSVTTSINNDADCDGIPTALDCDDNDPNSNAGGSSGISANCAAQSCNDVLSQDASAASGVYYIDPSGLGVNAVYCDMDLDGGGWTLVFINNIDGGMTDDDSTEQGDVTQLQSPSGGTAKFSDAYINAIREYSDARLGYRVTSNNISNRYFSPSECTYQHSSHSNLECRRYTSSYTASTSPSYTQCQNWGGNSGGLDAFYGCSGNWDYSNVFTTHMSASSTGGGVSAIMDNPSGARSGSSYITNSNDVLMWVR